MQTISTPTQPQAPEFNLTALTKFNPALVYGFDPESSINELDPVSTAYLAHLVGQWEDMFLAYYYAEHTIVPAIQAQGIKNITPKQLLGWLNDLHLRIASTLAKDSGVSAGEFTKAYGSRWHNGSIIEDIIYIYLSKDENFLGQSFPYLFNHMPRESFLSLKKKMQPGDNFQTVCLKLLGAFGVEEKDAQEFLQLLDKIIQDDSIKITEVVRRTSQLNLSNNQADASMGKFRFWYSDNNPSDEEKTIVEKVVSLFLPPEKIPQAMQAFAENLLAKWSICDPNDQDQLASLLYDAFNNLAGKIHPYFNANGRAATCLVNIILVSLGKQSILIRNPEERNNPNSSYSIAIKRISSDPNFLINHFKQRVQESEAGRAYSNSTLSTIICLRVELHHKICALRKEFPEVKIEQLNEALNQKANKQIKFDDNDLEASIIARLKFLLDEFDKFELNHRNQQQKLKKTPSPVITRQYKKEEVIQIVDKIKSFVNYNNYELKTYTTNGLTILLNLNDKEKARELISVFEKTKAMNVSLMYNPTTKCHVVKLENIIPGKLMHITTKEEEIDGPKNSSKPNFVN